MHLLEGCWQPSLIYLEQGNSSPQIFQLQECPFYFGVAQSRRRNNQEHDQRYQRTESAKHRPKNAGTHVCLNEFAPQDLRDSLDDTRSCAGPTNDGFELWLSASPLGPKPPLNNATRKLQLIHCPLANSPKRAVGMSSLCLLASYSLRT